MRITPDTGILVRINVKAPGPARRLLELILRGPHELVLSEFLLQETARVLQYPRLQRLYPLTNDDIMEHIEFLRARADIVSSEVLSPVVLSDPYDESGDLYGVQRKGRRVVRHRSRFLCTRCSRLLSRPG